MKKKPAAAAGSENRSRQNSLVWPQSEKDFSACLEKENQTKRKKDFFWRNAEYVGKNIIGDFLVFKEKKHILAGRIAETESYLGLDDDASHSFSGRKTARNEVLYSRGGVIYVYLIYGLYWCFNIVTASESKPQAVFIRALEPVAGWDYMLRRRKTSIKNLTNGPCRWTMAFGIDKKFLGKSITSGKIFILKKKRKDFVVGRAARVGIDYARQSKNFPLRFYIKGSSYVSKK